MKSEISRDDGTGGSNDANNREYGGAVDLRDGVHVHIPSPPGEVGKAGQPGLGMNVDITSATYLMYHSHASGSLSSGGITTSWTQIPSPADLQRVGNNMRGYVFGRRDGILRIHSSRGITATMPSRHFVNP